MELGAVSSDRIAEKVIEARGQLTRLSCVWALDDLSVKVKYVALEWLKNEHNRKVMDSILDLIPKPTKPVEEPGVMAAMRGGSGASAAEAFMASILMGRAPKPKPVEVSKDDLVQECMRVEDRIKSELGADEIDLLFAKASGMVAEGMNSEAITMASRKVERIMAK